MAIFSPAVRNQLLERAEAPLEGPFEVVAGSDLLKAYPKLHDAIDRAKREAGNKDNIQIVDSESGEVLFDDRDPNPAGQLAKLRKRL